MLSGKRTLSAIVLLFLSVAPATAVTTTTETYTFDATLTSGHLMCGEFVGLESPCADDFGTYSGSPEDDLMFGKSIGDTYEGRISLGFDGDSVSEITCQLGGENCYFGDDFFREPIGPNPRLDFSLGTIVLSSFQFTDEAGTYFFGTDYKIGEDGVRYYTGVEFDLTNVIHEISSVPLSGSVGFLALALGGIAAFSRRKTRALIKTEAYRSRRLMRPQSMGRKSLR